MQSCIYKIYSSILNNRLDCYLEENEKLCNTQNGFRRDRSCVDHVFTLSEIIRLNTRTAKSKVFACFVDMRAAFDEVDRNLLIHRLMETSVSGNMLKAMNAIYKSPQCKVKLTCGWTNWITSNFGVLQGDCISPKSFSVQINKLLGELKQSGIGLYHGDEESDRIPCLCYADDIVLLASSERDLQRLVNIVSDYCDKWRMSVNADKTQTMVFRKNRQCKAESVKIVYKGRMLKQVKEYKYL